MEKIYDVVVIGSGPAGLSAGLYAARAKMTTLILEKSKVGGQVSSTEEVANYPGSIENPTGPSLVARMVEQCKDFGAVLEQDHILEVKQEDQIKVLKGQKDTYYARSIIVAPGSKPKLMGVPGEQEFTGKGVSYCATCDADFFTDLEVFVIGGGDAAVEEALFITRFARKVTIVHRRDQLAAAKTIQEKAFKHDKIHFMWNSTVAEIKGEGIVEAIVFKNTKTGELTEYKASEEDGTMGVFVFVGNEPQTEIFKGLLDMDERGYLITDSDMRTNVPGIFAAGDCRVKSLRQVVTAVSDGAIAAVQAEKYIEATFHE
ncbi:thioredoxin-disulfide reductase [Alkaliphilus crotonatoxidans]